MATARMLPTNLFFNPGFTDLHLVSKVAYIGLLLNADDDGRGHIHLRALSRAIDLCETDVESSLLQLAEKGLILVYVVDDKEYYQITGWFDMQSIRHPRPSILPVPQASEVENPIATEGARKNHTVSPLLNNGASIISISKINNNNNNNTMCVDDIHFTEEEMTLMKLLNCKDGEAIRGLTQEYPGVHLIGEAYAAKDWASTNKRKLSLATFRTWLAKSSRLKEAAATSKSTSTHGKKVSPYKAKLEAEVAQQTAEYAARSEAENNAHKESPSKAKLKAAVARSVAEYAARLEAENNAHIYE